MAQTLKALISDLETQNILTLVNNKYNCACGLKIVRL